MAASSVSNTIADGLTMPWWRDGRERHCAYCGRMMRKLADGKTLTSPTRDHVIARSHGGPNVTIPACLECNRAKGAMSLQDFMKSSYFVQRRTHLHGKAWREHELWSALAVASLRLCLQMMQDAKP